MTGMLEGCKEITKINISQFNLSSFKTDNAQNLSLMFAHCYSLERLDLTSFKKPAGYISVL